jgi:chromosome segregation ATPase
MSPPVPDGFSPKTVAAITPLPEFTGDMGTAAPEDSPSQVESGIDADDGPTELQQLQDAIAQMLQKTDEVKKDLKTKSSGLEASRQRIQRLEGERDTLQTKYDTASRQADALKRDNADLLNSVTERDNQIKSLAREKHHAIAGHLHAQSMNIEKDKDIQNLNRELNTIATAYQELTRR